MHVDKPFQVVGILNATGTAIDQSLYVTLEGLEALHIDWKDGAAPTEATQIPAEQIRKEDLQIRQITAFFLKTKSRIETLRLQREINTYTQEALLAIIPGATLSELWRGLSQIDNILKFVSWLVFIVGLAAMISTLLASLDSRKREMAIFRALGANIKHLFSFMLLESFIIVLTGAFLGLALELLLFFSLSGWLETEFGLYLTGSPVSLTDFVYLGLTIAIGLFAGCIPALIAARRSLKQGLNS